MRPLALAAALALCLPGCMGPRAPGAAEYLPGAAAWWMEPVVFGEEAAEEEDEGAGVVGVGHTILMYLPNRVLDVFDIARAGVNVGPGIGAQLKATDAAQVTFMSRTSAGLGLQGLRHLPAYASVENAAGAGPLSAESSIGVGWYQSPTDIRVELHPLVAGAHVAVDPVEILDFLVGLFTFDLRDDDY